LGSNKGSRLPEFVTENPKGVIMHSKTRQSRMLPPQFLSLFGALAILAALQACSSSEQQKPTSAPSERVLLLKGAGATFPAPLYKQWFAAYQADHPGTVVTYDAVGSGEGVRRFVGKNVKEEEKVDFGASDAAMTDQEIQEVARGAVLLPVTAGSVVLTYNLPEVEKDLRLSRKAYAGIFLGSVKRWDDPLIAEANPDIKLPKLDIFTVVRQDRSGTTYAFTKHLDAINSEWHRRYGSATQIDWPCSPMRAPGNEGVAARIQQSISSIGYVGYEFAQRLGLKVAILENREGRYVKPNEQTTAASLNSLELPDNLRGFVPDPPGADAYPIVTFSWILLYRNYESAERAKAITQLFQWCLADGQKYASKLGYVPLSSQVAAKTLSTLGMVTLGETTVGHKL
jgi:phosphate transport system substrate-binding protein